MPTTPTVFSAAIGTILGAFPGGNYYNVVTDHGQFEALWCGASLGEIGVTDSGGLMPGTQVIVLFQPGESKAWILTANPLPHLFNDADNPDLRVMWPMLTGFNPRDTKASLQGQLFNADLFGRYHAMNGLQGMQAGEWAKTSPFGGGGLGVELFRSWVRGGPASGLQCFHDSQLTRLFGLEMEQWSMLREHHERRRGNSLEEITRRVLWPTEALNDAAPRRLDLGGALFGGWDRYVLPVADPRETTAPPALFHEHLGTDGMLAITSATGILFQRLYGVPTPQELPGTTVTADGVTLAPTEDPARLQQVLTSPRPPGERDGIDQGWPFSWGQRVRDLIDDVTRLRTNDPIQRLPGTFKNQPMPDLTLDSITAHGMWSAQPKITTVLIDQVAGTRKIHAGRSTFALLPDGSVQITDARNSQILMAGGNIYLSAPHDIIMVAGRNITQIAGGAALLKARKEVDIASNESRVSVKAEQLLSLLGGNDHGNDGVLIESRATGDLAVPGTGSQGATPGILLKSASVLEGYAGTQMSFKSEGVMSLVTAPGATMVLSCSQVLASTQEGLGIKTSANEPYLLSPATASIPGAMFVKSTMWAGVVYVDDNVLAMGQIAGQSVVPIGDDPAVTREFNTAKRQRDTSIKDAIKSVATALKQFDEVWNKLAVAPAQIAKVGFSFLTSAQRGIYSGLQFILPAPLWRILSTKNASAKVGVWVERPVPSPAGEARTDAPTKSPESSSVSIDNNLPYMEF